ncbi:MAG: FAD-dependent oxidoreductase, partial [Opitutales bacterium]
MSKSISRRNFLSYSAAGMAAVTTTHVAVGGRNTGTATVDPVSTEVDVQTEVDVLVVGGGTAGTIAAIQAGRLGARTLLLERNGQLGGQTTTGGVSYPGLFDAWGKQIIAGIGWEMVEESVALDNGKLPNFSKVPNKHFQNQVQVNQFIYALLAEEKCTQAGVQIAYHEFINSLKKVKNGWEVDCIGFGTRRKVLCKQIVDCSGGAEAVGLMGHERLRGEERQPGSYLYQLGSAAPHGRRQLMRVYVHGADSTNSRTVTEANLVGREEILKNVRKSKKLLTHLQPEAGFRESYRIVGETMITVNDYRSGRRFDDAIAYA